MSRRLVVVAAGALALASGAAPAFAAQAPPVRLSRPEPVTGPVHTETWEVATPDGHVRFYLSRPTTRSGALPLVVVAHGFSRTRFQMAEWGEHLARQGFVAVVPDLPAWADPVRNGRAINGLVASLLAHPPPPVVLDAGRIALMGFSAGGVATLIAAADNPVVRLWIGLDPVGRGDVGTRAAARLRASSVVLLAEPSWCNGHAGALVAALGSRARVRTIAGAAHTDAEWPTSAAARLVCGGSEAGRRQFVALATAALHEHLR